MQKSLLMFSVGALVLAGCGSEAAKVPVRGKVTFKGQPLTDGSVMFVAQGSGVTATGTIKPDGTYELHSGKPGEGITPGAYKVSIAPAFYDPRTGSPPKFATKYQDPEMSGLTAEVKDGAGVFDFDLKDGR